MRETTFTPRSPCCAVRENCGKAVAHDYITLGFRIKPKAESGQVVLFEVYFASRISVVPQFEITPKAFANFSPGLEAQRQPWD